MKASPRAAATPTASTCPAFTGSVSSAVRLTKRRSSSGQHARGRMHDGLAQGRNGCPRGEGIARRLLCEPRDRHPDACRPPHSEGRECDAPVGEWNAGRSEEHTSALPSLMRISYAVFCLEKQTTNYQPHTTT